MLQLGRTEAHVVRTIADGPRAEDAAAEDTHLQFRHEELMTPGLLVNENLCSFWKTVSCVRRTRRSRPGKNASTSL